jgi:methyl-accepting chemotaxis protein
VASCTTAQGWGQDLDQSATRTTFGTTSADTAEAEAVAWIVGIVAALLIGIGIGAASTPEEEQSLGVPTGSSPSSPPATTVEETTTTVEETTTTVEETTTTVEETTTTVEETTTTVAEPTEPADLDGTWKITACDLQLHRR